jgi:hypothetical protein
MGMTSNSRSGHLPALAAIAGVIALVLLGWALRWRGLDWLLPQFINRDGIVWVKQVTFLRDHVQLKAEDWQVATYPTMVARVVALFPAPGPDAAGARTLPEHLAAASAPWLELRRLSMLLSLITIPATYFLARRFLDRAASLFATALLATSLLHIGQSIQEKPHAAATSFTLLALLAALRCGAGPMSGRTSCAPSRRRCRSARSTTGPRAFCRSGSRSCCARRKEPEPRSRGSSFRLRRPS